MQNKNNTDYGINFAKLKGIHQGKTGLIVLGGPSAKDWQSLKDKLKPDVLIIANGANFIIKDADFWVFAENMVRSERLARQGDPRHKQFMEVLRRPMPEKTQRLVNYKSIRLLKKGTKATPINIKSYILNNFNCRTYGNGLITGPILSTPNTTLTPYRAGTVALQCLHVAGILGLSAVATIGLDLSYVSSLTHHWYDYPVYEADAYRSQEMFTTYRGLNTQHAWIETANYLLKVNKTFAAQGLVWTDYSHGLIDVIIQEQLNAKELHPTIHQT